MVNFSGLGSAIRATFFVCMTFIGVLYFSQSAQAQGGIRDAETEALIADYALPIFRAANVSSNNIHIHLVNDKTFNAFVVDGQNMFLHIGAILKSSTPNQLIGVIAHETGHIEGSHVTRMQSQIARAQQAALWFQLLGIAAMAGGAIAGGGEGGNDLIGGGAAVMYGGQTAAMKSFLMYRRAEESSADQAAVRYLNATHQSARGMLEVFRQFAEQTMGARNIDPYVQTHPMPQDRIAQLEDLVLKSPYYNNKDSAELQLRHDMVRAKLDAFTNRKNRSLVMRNYPESNQGLPARYARAIVTCYSDGARAAMPLVDQLIAAMPSNAYLYEFKGQCLMEEGGSMMEAIQPLRRAVQLQPKAALIRILLAQALLNSENKSFVGEAVENLKQAIIYETENPSAYQQLANAYAQQNKIAEAELATAQMYFYRGRYKDAAEQAKRAQMGFPLGSPNWLKADDIINFKPPKSRI